MYMAHKIQKLRAQNARMRAAAREDEDDGRAIFQRVCVYVDGYTVPRKEEIRRLMLLHGGTLEQYVTTQVTHIIATQMPALKLRLFTYVLLGFFMVFMSAFRMLTG